ncbi:D-alanine--D-alanine ligase family protein [Nonomuraea thailandensis]|uniref:D-alanine--D-alanine ligase family protein n=1 Tax=Nonomuraea thailandensis TaxID=1188745 RepID=UPI0020A4D262|nr:D-alanine--D-alanine ligase [Nonomuraea thailandensis]
MAVLFGGGGAERSVSVASAVQVVTALRERGHQADAFDTGEGRLGPAEQESGPRTPVAAVPLALAALRHGRVSPRLVQELLDADVIFLALHGGAGENGVIQAILDTAGPPYTGSGRLASTIAMDKDLTKRLLRAAGIQTAPWRLLRAADTVTDLPPFDGPMVVKPNAQVSSIGLSLVREHEQLPVAVRLARAHDADVLVERFVPGREFVVGVLDGVPLAVGEILLGDKAIFDYEARCRAGESLHDFPADISAGLQGKLQSLAVRVHATLRLGAYSRVDFRMDHEGGIWCLEANTLPALTATSFFPQSAQAAGVSFPDLCERICRLAVRA